MHMCVGGRLSGEGRVCDPQEAAEIQLFFFFVFWMPWLLQRLTNNVSNEEEDTGKEMRGEIGEANSTRPR